MGRLISKNNQLNLSHTAYILCYTNAKDNELGCLISVMAQKITHIYILCKSLAVATLHLNDYGFMYFAMLLLLKKNPSINY